MDVQAEFSCITVWKVVWMFLVIQYVSCTMRDFYSFHLIIHYDPHHDDIISESARRYMFSYDDMCCVYWPTLVKTHQAKPQSEFMYYLLI